MYAYTSMYVGRIILLHGKIAIDRLRIVKVGREESPSCGAAQRQLLPYAGVLLFV